MTFWKYNMAGAKPPTFMTAAILGMHRLTLSS
jgi:hypothetical protein